MELFDQNDTYMTMRTLFSRYNIFLACVVLVCATVVIFMSPKETNVIPSNNTDTWKEVYHRAYAIGITTIPNIEEANPDGTVYRKFAAKMVTLFAMKIFGRVPDTTRICTFKDIRKENTDLQYYIQLSCQLGIMGVDYYGNPDMLFNPNYVLTRDQFATILSRILFGNTYNIMPGELTFSRRVKNFFIHTRGNICKALSIPTSSTSSLDWYTKHMDAIKKLGVMTNYTPSLKEFRAPFMSVMYKISRMEIERIHMLVK